MKKLLYILLLLMPVILQAQPYRIGLITPDSVVSVVNQNNDTITENLPCKDFSGLTGLPLPYTAAQFLNNLNADFAIMETQTSIAMRLISWSMKGSQLRNNINNNYIDIENYVDTLSLCPNPTYAMYFNGVDDSVSIPKYYGIGDTASRVFATSMWIKKDEWTGVDEYIWHQSNSSTEFPDVYLYVESTDSTLNFNHRNSGGANNIFEIGKVVPGSWHNVMIIHYVYKPYAGANTFIYQSFYFDGVPQGGRTITWTPTVYVANHDQTYLGVRGRSGGAVQNWYKGYIADWRVWKAIPTTNKFSEVFAGSIAENLTFDEQYMGAYPITSATDSYVQNLTGADSLLVTDSLLIFDEYTTYAEENSLFTGNDSIFWTSEVPSNDSIRDNWWGVFKLANGWHPYGTTARDDHLSPQALFDSGKVYVNLSYQNHMVHFDTLGYFYPPYLGLQGSGDDHENTVHTVIGDSLVMLRSAHGVRDFRSTVIHKDYLQPDSGKWNYTYLNNAFPEDTGDFLQTYFHTRKFPSDDTIYFTSRLSPFPDQQVVFGRSVDSGHNWVLSDTIFNFTNSFINRWCYPSIFEISGSNMWVGTNVRNADAMWRTIYLAKSSDRGYTWEDMQGNTLTLPLTETSTSFVDSVSADSILQVTDTKIIGGVPYIMAVRGDTATVTLKTVIYKWDGSEWDMYDTDITVDNMWDHPTFVHWTGKSMYIACSQGGTGDRWAKSNTYYAAEKYKFGGQTIDLFIDSTFISDPSDFFLDQSIGERVQEWHEVGLYARQRYPIGVTGTPEDAGHFWVIWNMVYREEFWRDDLDYSDETYTVGRPMFRQVDVENKYRYTPSGEALTIDRTDITIDQTDITVDQTTY